MLAGSFLRYQQIYGKKATAQVASLIEEGLNLPEAEIAQILDVGKPPDETIEWLTEKIRPDGDDLFQADYPF